MAKKNPLGRGLDALLEENTPSYQEAGISGFAEGIILNLNPLVLKPNPYQPRKIFDDQTIEELAVSIKEHGIIQPIVVEKTDDEFFIISGERRTRAAITLGLDTVPVVIKTFDDNRKLEVALIENIQREDLNVLEEALAYQQIMEIACINQEELSKRVGKSRSAITNTLRILKLPEDMKKALSENKITAGHARSLLSVVNPADQQILFKRILEEDLSVRDAEAVAADFNAGIGRISKKTKTGKKPVSDDDIEIRDLEQQFINSLGTKVQIKGTIKKGIIEISYFSKDDLNSFYEKIK